MHQKHPPPKVAVFTEVEGVGDGVALAFMRGENTLEAIRESRIAGRKGLIEIISTLNRELPVQLQICLEHNPSEFLEPLAKHHSFLV
jgi:hypothetical protein